jgi:hypothetical protein
MIDKQKSWDISYCGLNCSACEIYFASHGNTKLHERLLSWFQDNIDSSIDKISCEGCRGPEEKCWTNNCYFRDCAKKRGYSYCFQCAKMPCEKLTEFANDGMGHHTRTIENINDMKKMGLKKWISSQDGPKFCP